MDIFHALLGHLLVGGHTGRPASAHRLHFCMNSQKHSWVIPCWNQAEAESVPALGVQRVGEQQTRARLLLPLVPVFHTHHAAVLRKQT